MFKSKHGLKAHTKQQHMEKAYLICDICKKTFTSKIGIKRHLDGHVEETKPANDHYNKFIAENFDMSCDQCDTVFVSLYDARLHYKEKHNEKKGYIKCCQLKLREFWTVTDHIESHINPVNKWVFVKTHFSRASSE